MVKKIFLIRSVRYIISFGLLGILFFIMRKEMHDIRLVLRSASMRYIGIAMAINLVPAFLLGLRLKILMSGQGIRLGIRDAVSLTFIGYFFNNFLPTAIGGDIAKAYYAAKKTDNKAGSYAAVFSDRLFGFVATIVLAMTGLVFIGYREDSRLLLFAVAGMFFALSTLLFVLFRKKASHPKARGKGAVNFLKEKMYKLYYAINLYRKDPLLILKTIALSVFMQACAIASIYFFIRAIGREIAFLKLFFIIPVVWALSMLPSINGLGIRESAFVFFLKSDIGSASAFTISLLWLGVIICYSLIGGVFHIFYPLHQLSSGEMR